MQKLKTGDIVYLSENVLKNLKRNRITTLLEFLQEDFSKLSTITKLNLPQILAMRNDIFTKYSAPVKNGCELLENSLVKNISISSDIDRLDAILQGGIPRGYITELCGLPDSGKTQLCFQLAINCSKNNNNTVLYVDTKGDFSAIRIQKILDALEFSHKEMADIMSRIKVVRIWTMNELIELFQSIKQKVIVFENLSLVILDSLPCLMLQFLGDENKTGLKLLNIFVNYSRYLTTELQIGLICVNIQTRWVDQDVIDLEDEGELTTMGKETYTEKRNRCLGRYWQYIPYLVLQLEKGQDNNSVENGSRRVLSVLKSSSMENLETQCSLNISILGVT